MHVEVAGPLNLYTKPHWNSLHYIWGATKKQNETGSINVSEGGNRSIIFNKILQNAAFFTSHTQKRTKNTRDDHLFYLQMSLTLLTCTTFPLPAKKKKKKVKQVLFRQVVFHIFGTDLDKWSESRLPVRTKRHIDKVTMVDKQNKMTQDRLKTIL